MPPQLNQPEELQTEEHVDWAWGKGQLVWEILNAAHTGDLAGVKRLVETDASLLRCAWQYRTPMHMAAREGHLHIVRYLFEQGADAVNLWRSGHINALQLAEDRGHQDVADYLSNALKTKWGICPAGDEIAAFIRERQPEEARQRIEKDLNLVGAADARGNRPLHWSAMTRQLPLIDFLLERGADINQRRPDGARPIDLTNGDYYYRVEKGFPKRAVQSHQVVIGYLLAKGADYDLVTACHIGDLERVQAILAEDPQTAKQVPPYQTWYSGFPLRVACNEGHKEIVRVLLDYGADPNQPEHGLAPKGGALHAACENGDVELCRMLLEAGSVPNQTVESCGDCLYIAKNNEVRKLLAEYGASWNILVYYLGKWAKRWICRSR